MFTAFLYTIPLLVLNKLSAVLPTTHLIQVNVTVSLSGLGTRTSVAIHVHDFGDLTSAMGKMDGNSAGGHWVGAGSTTHGCPPSATRHAGDMGSWDGESLFCVKLLTSSKLTTALLLSPKHSISWLCMVPTAPLDGQW